MADNPYQAEFWESEDGDLWDDIAEEILNIYFSGVDGGVDALTPDVRVLVDFDRVNTDAMEYARRYRYELIKGITDTTRRQVQKTVSAWIASGSPLDALEASLERTFGSVRASMIAQTESNRVYAAGNQEAFVASGVVDEWEWRTTKQDVCPICVSRDGKRYKVGDMNALPPAHINCRCWLQPVVSLEALERKLSEVLA